MKSIFYRTIPAGRKSALVLGALLAVSACGPRIQKVDDNKLAGVPEERLTGVNEAKKELLLAKVELEKARDGVTEAGFRLRIMRAAERVAEARFDHAKEEAALAKFQNVNDAMIKAGENERDSQNAMSRAKADVDVAKAALSVAELRLDELEKRLVWLEAKFEHERAKVALRYDVSSPNEKSAQLNEYEQTAIRAQLSWSETDGKLKQALVEFDSAKQARAALDAVK